MYDGMCGMETLAKLYEDYYQTNFKYGDHNRNEKVKQDLSDLATQYLALLEQM